MSKFGVGDKVIVWHADLVPLVDYPIPAVIVSVEPLEQDDYIFLELEHVGDGKMKYVVETKASAVFLLPFYYEHELILATPMAEVLYL